MTWEIVRHDLRPGGGEAVVVEVHATRAEGERRILELRQERERGSPFVHALRQHRDRAKVKHAPRCSSQDPSCFYQAGCDCKDPEGEADRILRNAGHGELAGKGR